MVRKWFVAATAAALLAGTAVPAWAAIPARVVVGDVELVSPAPFIEDGRTLAPIDSLAAALRAKVNISEDGQNVELVKWPKRINLTVGSDTAVINGNTVKFDAPVQNVDGTLYVPVRSVVQALGGQVSWDQETWTVTVQPVAPEVEQAWDLLAKSNELVQVALKGVGSVITETAASEEESLTVTINLEVLADGANALSTVTVEGQDVTAQSALFNGQLWVNTPEAGWTQLDLQELLGIPGMPPGLVDLASDLNALKRLGEDMLASADAAVTAEEVINGVQTYRVDVDLNTPELADFIFGFMSGIPIEGLKMNIDKYVLSNWIDAEGFTHKMTMDVVMSMTFEEEGQDPFTVVSKMLGEFVFEPLTEAITWPEAILNPAPAEPAEEQPAEEQPAEEQPAE